MPQSIFVSFEGGEGAGKTTQAALLYEQFMERDIPVILVQEPGSTSLGWDLREILKSRDTLSYSAELFLFAAARAQLVTEVIKPNLRKGVSVISDRFADSTITYQGYGRGINLDTIKVINTLATNGLEPHRTILFDLTPEQGLGRIAPLQPSFTFWVPSEEEPGLQPRLPSLESQQETLGRVEAGGQRRFEEASKEFHERVREGFLKLAESNPERWIVVDATRSKDELRQEIWRHVGAFLEVS